MADQPREPRVGDRIYFEGSQTTPSAEGTIKLVLRGHVFIKWDVGCANWVPRWILREDRWGYCDERAAPPKLFRPSRSDYED